MDACGINKILLFGGGCALGALLSIMVMDYIYKGQMKRAIDEIHRQYKRALDIIQKRNKV